ncbi:MAG: trehalose-6-phosphate synthase [Phycisphaerales bacterium]
MAAPGSSTAELKSGARQRSGQAESGRLVVVANRLPVRRVRDDEGDRWVTSPGGLVAAVHPLLRERGGSWVGWDGTAGKGPDPFDHEGFRVHPVGVSADELENFYYGFSNETVWPLYHDCIRAPQYHRRWWRAYQRVNERFADGAVEAAGEHDTVWIHDYQLQLVPGLVRERRPGARIGFFNHIPFPPEELFAKLPWRRQILEGLLGADLVGFQTKLAAKNFARSARQLTSATGTDTTLQFEGRTIRVGAFPISIDAGAFEEKVNEERTRRAAEKLSSDFGGRRVILGVDRLDYTKGIDVRLRAYEEMLRRGRVKVEDVIYVQIAVPTREKVDEYADLRSSVNELVGRINGTYATMENIAVHYVYRSLPFDELVGCYRAADVMTVTPFRDGMNLVAKEYVATRTDGSGVLVLSEFAGAALELKQALLVNPHDVDGIADALERALALDEADARKRMASMRRIVRAHDVYAWSDAFLGRLGR